MITSTVLAVFFVPVFYVVFQGWSERRARGKRASVTSLRERLSVRPAFGRPSTSGPITGGSAGASAG